MKKFFTLTALLLLSVSTAFATQIPLPSKYELPNGQRGTGFFEKVEGIDEEADASVSSWFRYRANFGMEKVSIRFPHAPTVSQGNSLYIAYSYDSSACYTLTGFFPPLGNVNPRQMFEETLYAISQPPYDLVCQNVYYCDYYDYWVLDYVMRDTYKNMIVESRTVVTPFNAYTMQTVYPYSYSGYHEYFIDSFSIRCECCD